MAAAEAPPAGDDGIAGGVDLAGHDTAGREEAAGHPFGNGIRVAVRWAWTRLDRDGWVRPGYAAWLAWQVAIGRYTPIEAWCCWVVGPYQHRHSRRRADAARRFRRLDGVERTFAKLYGWQALRPMGVGAHERREQWTYRKHGTWVAVPARGPAAPPRRPPRWWLRRARLIRRMARAVAGGYLRPAAVPDVWVVAAAVSDRIDLT